MHGRVLLLGLILGASAYAQTAPVAPSLAPIHSFTRFDEFGGMKISPDGQFVAVLSGKEGRAQLTFIDLASKKVVSGVQTEGASRINMRLLRVNGRRSRAQSVSLRDRLRRSI
jgi:hypothetical protein